MSQYILHNVGYRQATFIVCSPHILLSRSNKPLSMLKTVTAIVVTPKKKKKKELKDTKILRRAEGNCRVWGCWFVSLGSLFHIHTFDPLMSHVFFFFC